MTQGNSSSLAGAETPWGSLTADPEAPASPAPRRLGKEDRSLHPDNIRPRPVGFLESVRRSFSGGAHEAAAGLLRTGAALEQPQEPALLPEDDEGIRRDYWFGLREPDAAELSSVRERNKTENARRKSEYDAQLADSDALFARGDAQAELARRQALQPGEEHTLGGTFGAILGGVIPGFLDMPFSAQQRAVEVLQNGGTVRDAAKVAAIQAPVAAILMEAPVRGGRFADALLGSGGRATRLAARSAGGAAASAAAVPVQNAADYVGTPDGQSKPSLIPSWQQLGEAAAQGAFFGHAKGRKAGEGEAAAQTAAGAERNPTRSGAPAVPEGTERPALSGKTTETPERGSGEGGGRDGPGAGMVPDGAGSVGDAGRPEAIAASHQSGELRPFDLRESRGRRAADEKALNQAGQHPAEARRLATELEHARMRRSGFDPNAVEDALAPQADAAAGTSGGDGAAGGDPAADGDGPDPRFVLDRDGGRHTQPEQGRLLGRIETVTGRSADGGHAVIEPHSGMVLARGASREAANQAAQEMALELGRRRLQARIDAEQPRSQQQLREWYGEGGAGGEGEASQKRADAGPEAEAAGTVPGEGRSGLEGAALPRSSSAPNGTDIPDGNVQKGRTSKAWRSLPEPVRKLIEQGNEFNRSRRKHYPHNELEVLDAAGNKFRLDSYHPDKGEIVSRKFSQLAGIKPETAIGYLRELLAKYPSGAIISHSVFNHKHLRGERISGGLILEVPVQDGSVPKSVLDYAKRNKIQIRDVNGVVH